MLDQCRLHLSWTNPVAGTLDDIIITAHKPEVAVLVLYRFISRVVPAVYKHRRRCLGVVQILLKETDRTWILCLDRNLSFLSDRHLIALLIMQLHAPSWSGLADGSRLIWNTGEGTNDHHSLGLAVCLVDRLSCCLFPDTGNLRVQRLTGRHTVPQFREVKRLQIRQNQHPVNRRRSTERRDLVVFNQRQKFGCIELSAVIVHKHTGALHPGAVELTPGGLAPSGVCDREMQIVFRQIIPEPSGYNVSQRISVRMQHHLWITGRSRREEDQHRIGCLCADTACQRNQLR